MAHVNLRRQTASNACGPVCLQMVAEYRGRLITLDDAVRACRPGPNGASLAQLAEAAEHFGFRALMARLPINQLARVDFPCIAFSENSHFVVIEHVSRTSVRVADPFRGRITYSISDFAQQWTQEGNEGVLLLLEPVREFKPTEKLAVPGAGFFIGYVSGRHWQIAQVLTSIVLGSVLQLLIAYTTRTLVDVAIHFRNMHFVYVVLAAQLMMFVTRLLNDFFRGWIMVHVSAGTNISLLADFLRTLLRLPFANFERRPVGDVLQRFADHSRIQSFLTSGLAVSVSAFGNLLIFGVALFLLNAYVALIFSAASLLLATWIYAFSGRRRELDNRLFAQTSITQTTLVEILGGSRDVRLSTSERIKREQWEKLQAKQFNLRLASLKLNQWLQGGALGLNEFKNIVISCVAASQVIAGNMTLGTMLAIAYMVGALNGPIDQIVSFFQTGQDAKISAERIGEIHSMPADDAENARLPVPSNLDIHLAQVSFRYDPRSADVLRSVSLDIPQGTRLAIVGTSGSGKTTLVKLLLKLYQPGSGSIEVGSTSLRDLDAAEWRTTCGVVMQDGFIFSDTLAANIILGCSFVDETRLRKVIEDAVLGDLVARLPRGAETVIGQYGHALSAGERQRVLIARALYKDPAIVILDEATSSLDGATERQLVDNLGRALSGKTVLTIAHRLSTLMMADRIAVLENGILTECGAHADLVSAKGGYYKLIRNQLEIAT